MTKMYFMVFDGFMVRHRWSDAFCQVDCGHECQYVYEFAAHFIFESIRTFGKNQWASCRTVTRERNNNIGNIDRQVAIRQKKNCRQTASFPIRCVRGLVLETTPIHGNK